MKLKTTLTVDDVAAWSVLLHQLKRKNSKMRGLLSLALMVLALIALSLSDCWLNSGLKHCIYGLLDASFERAIFVLLPVIVGTAVYFVLSSSRLYSSCINRQLHGLIAHSQCGRGPLTQQIQLSENGVTMQSDATTLTVPWPSFTNYFETAEHFFTTYGITSALILPKRDLSPVEIDELRAWLAEKIEPRR